MEWCSFAACTDDVTVISSRQTVSAPGASRAILCRRQLLNLLIAFWLFRSEKWLLAYFFATAIHNRLLRSCEIFFKI